MNEPSASMRQIVRADQPATTTRPCRSMVMPLAWREGWTRTSWPMPGRHCQIVSPMMSVNRNRLFRWSQTGPSPNVMPWATWSSGGLEPVISLKAGSLTSMSKRSPPGRNRTSDGSRLRRLLFACHIEREDPSPVKKRRRRHLAIVGELLTRLQGHPRGARLPLANIGPERGVDVVVTGEVARQHVTVFDRHVAALRERRHGRMRGVTQERNAPPRPLWHRIAIVDAPFEHMADVPEHAEQRLVPAFVGGE